VKKGRLREDKLRNIHPKLAALGIDKEILPSHRSGGGREWTKTGIIKGLAFCDFGLQADHSKTFNIFCFAFSIDDDPSPPEQLHWTFAKVADSHLIGEKIEGSHRIGLFGHKAGRHFDLNIMGDLRKWKHHVDQNPASNKNCQDALGKLTPLTP